MKKILFFIPLQFLFFSEAFSAGWHEVGEVTRIHTGHGTASFDNNAVYFTTKIQIKNNSCASSVGYTFRDDNTNTDRIYSLLLAAYMSKRPISIYFTDRCLGSRPEVDAVQFKDEGVAF